MLERRIAIIGGGITGLSAAHRVMEIDPEARVTLFEGSQRLGGSLQTESADGYLIEQGGDMFTTREPWAMDLCRRIGFEDQLIETNAHFRRAFIVHRGRLVPVPEGFTLMTPTKIWPVVSTPLLSWTGKLRLAYEYLIPPRTDGEDESLAEFTRRRFGGEVFDRLVQPLIGGIYTADPSKLSVQAALPQFAEMERTSGSLIRSMRGSVRPAQRESGARYGSFLAPRHGMGTLVQALVDRLYQAQVEIRLNSRIESVASGSDGRWQLSTRGSENDRFDGVIVTSPAPDAGLMIRHAAPELAGLLQSIEYASAAVVAIGFPRERVEHALNGFGCVAPMIEHRRVLSVSFGSVKFPGRAPDGHVLLRAFVGGACQGELVELDDDALYSLVEDELRELIGARGAADFRRIFRWREAMPQYHVGHVRKVDRIETLSRELPRFALAGNAYRGVGIPFCVRSGEAAAERVLAE